MCACCSELHPCSCFKMLISYVILGLKGLGIEKRGISDWGIGTKLLGAGESCRLVHWVKVFKW